MPSGNQCARSTSGISFTRPDLGGHWISNVLLGIFPVRDRPEATRRDDLARLLANLSEVGHRAGRRRPELLFELPPGRRLRVLAGLVLPFRDRPCAEIAARPRGATRIDQHLERAGAPEKDESGAAAARSTNGEAHKVGNIMAVGLALAFTAAVANAVAIVLQASEARCAPSESVRFSLLFGLARRPRWLAGTALLIIAWPSEVSGAVAPITVAQPMLCSFQIVLLLLAWLTLGERIGGADVIAALMIAIGLGLVVSAAPRHTVVQPSAIRLAIPLAVVGIAALLGFLTSRVRPQAGCCS